jgi:hypothetical protein
VESGEGESRGSVLDFGFSLETAHNNGQGVGFTHDTRTSYPIQSGRNPILDLTNSQLRSSRWSFFNVKLF